MNEEILSAAAFRIGFLWRDRGFRVLKCVQAPRSRDGYVVIGDAHLRLRYSRDRGQEFLSAATADPDSEWYDLDLVRDVLSGDVLSDPWEIESLAQWLSERLDNIQELVSPPRVEETVRRLKALEKIRVRKMFPGMFD